MSFQLPLDFRLRDESTLERFVTGPNAALLDTLQQLASSGEPVSIYISGPQGIGKTHLLQGCARGCQDAMYIPLAMIETITAEIFEGLEARGVLYIDDVESLAGNHDLEVALFSLMKRIRDNRHSLVLSAATIPVEAGFKLKDLLSRLNGCMQFQVIAPEEKDIRDFIQQDAQRRGIEISEEISDWILTHLPRDMKSLSALLNKLDQESLRAQRRITIPFIKELL